MKKGISFVLALALVLSAASLAFAEPQLSDVAFVGDLVTLSLEDVVNRVMTTGTAIETAKINKQSDMAIADGYSESYTSIQNALDYMDMVGLAASSSMNISESVSDINASVIRLTKNFAKDNLETNAQAELNSIELGAYKLFYDTFTAQQSYNISKDSLASKQTILANVQKKYNLGAASKMELMSAQSAVVNAQNDLAEAFVMYNSARLNMNFQLSYPLTQNTILKGELKPVTAPAVSLNDAIASAKKNRNEVGVVMFNRDIQTMLFNNVKLTTNSKTSKYKKQQVAYLTAMQSANSIEAQMEMDIRVQYMGLAQKRQAVDAAENTVNLATEAARIAQITYNAGMSTLADLQEAQVTKDQAMLGRIAAITAYNQAVRTFEYAIGVGVTRLSL